MINKMKYNIIFNEKKKLFFEKGLLTEEIDKLQK